MNAKSKILRARLGLYSLVIAGSFAVVPMAGAVPSALDFDVDAGDGTATFEGVDNQSSSSDFNLTTPVTGSSAFAINDGSTNNNSDAYDDAFSFAVNSTLVPNGPDTVDLIDVGDDVRVIATPVLPAGFSGELEYFFFDSVGSDPLVRVFFSLTNTGSEATTADIEVATDFGSDGGERLEADGSNDDSFGAEDSFVVFSDDEDQEDPNLLFTFFGIGAAETPTQNGIFDSDDMNTLFELALAPGETQSLLLFGGLFDIDDTDLGDASDLGESLVGTLADLADGGYLTALSAGQIGSIVNYGQPSVADDVPEPGTLTLFGMGFAGLFLARRRRAKV